MNFQGFSKDNLHIGDVIITNDLSVEGTFILDEKIEVKSLIVEENAEIKGNLTVLGDIIVRDQVEFEDSIIEYNSLAGTLNNLYSWGSIAPYFDGIQYWSGIVRDSSSGIFFFINNESLKPTSTTSVYNNVATIDINRIYGQNNNTLNPTYSFRGSTSSGIYSSGIGFVNITTSDSQAFNFNPTSNITYRDILPHTTNTFDIGSSGTRFDNGFFNTLNTTNLIVSTPIKAPNGTILLPGFSFSSVGGDSFGMSLTGTELIFSNNGIEKLNIGASASESKNKIIIPVGSSATPTLTFAGSLTTGVYSSATNNLDISVNNSQKLNISTSSTTSYNKLLITSGTTSEPGIGFNLETNTGIFRSAPNTLSFTVDGVNKLDIGASQISLLEDTVCTGQIRGIQGSSAEPSYSYPAGPSTGMYFGSLGLALGFSLTGDDFLFLKKTSEVIETLKDIKPSVSNSFDLGSDSLRYKDIYAAGIIDSNSIVRGNTFQAKSRGTQLLPSYSFTDDLDTGMWSSGANNINFSVEGDSKFTIFPAYTKSANRFRTVEDEYITGLPPVSSMYQQLENITVSNTLVFSSIMSTNSVSGFVGYNTIPANTVKKGDSLDITCQGAIETKETPDIRIRLRFGSSTVFDTGNFGMKSISTVGFTIKGTVVFREDAAGLTDMASHIDFKYNGIDGFQISDGASLNMTIDQEISLQVAWGTASVDNIITSSICNINSTLY